jgi:hypothetical protein
MVQALTKKERQALHMNRPDEASLRVSMAIDRENQGGDTLIEQLQRERVVAYRAVEARQKAVEHLRGLAS